MSIFSGPNLPSDGLVFQYDASNVQKSWKGRPATNFYTNGQFNNGAHVTQAANGTYSNPVNDVVLFDNPGNSRHCLRTTAVGGSLYTEYEMIASGLQINTTYCMSCWYAWTPDWNGTTSIFHSRWFTSAGAEAGAIGGGSGTVIETKIVKGITWYRAYQTFTTGADLNGSHSWYAGYPSQNTAGYRYFTNFQLEVGSYPTPFSDGARSSTQAILDLTGNNTLTATSLTYANDNTFTFNGTSDRISAGTTISPSRITVSAWVYRTSSTVSQGIVRKNFAYALSLSSNTIQVAPGNNWVFYNTSIPIEMNTWISLIWTYDGSTMKLYKNGTQVWSTSLSGSLPSNSNETNVGYDDNGWWWGGKIDSVTIHNRALSALEVTQQFETNRGRYSI